MTRRVTFGLVALVVLVSARPGAAQTNPSLPAGTYLLEFDVVEDDCGHDRFIADLPPTVTIVVGPSGDLLISGDPPWVEIDAAVGSDGSVVGTGTGTVAGFGGVTVSLDGDIIQPGTIEGQLSFGAGGELPGGCPIVWRLVLISETPSPTATPVPEPTVAEPTATATPEPTATTAPEPTVSPTAEPTDAESNEGGGGWIWLGPIVGGLILMGLGLFLLARKKNCDDELRAWLAARKACEDARAAEQRVQAERDQAQQDLHDAEDDLDEHCESYPPACSENDPRDSWIEDSNVPGSRIDGLDTAAGRAWARAVWGKYKDGQLSAQQVEHEWRDGPSQEFRDEYRNRYPGEKTRHDQLEQQRQQRQADFGRADAELAQAQADRVQKCAAAEAARRALEECLDKPVPPKVEPGGDGGETSGGGTSGGDPGPMGPGGPATGGGSEQEPPCEDGCEREAGSKSINVNVPVDFRPIILGGDAHVAADRGRDIAAELKQVEIGAQALGRLFGLAPNAKLVHDFTIGGAVEAGTSVGSAVSGIPIPSNPAEAAANAIELAAQVAGAIVKAVPEWQERRLPDVELTIQWRAAPFALTCTEIEVCRNGVWVPARHRFTLERTGPDRSGGSRNLGGGFTWADAQREIQRWAGVFSRGQQRALAQMKDFKDACASGG